MMNVYRTYLVHLRDYLREAEETPSELVEDAEHRIERIDAGENPEGVVTAFISRLEALRAPEGGLEWLGSDGPEPPS